jgi:hypothetical protein
MEKGKLLQLLNEEIERLKQMDYAELVELVDKVEARQIGEGGSFYQVEIQAFFDDKKTGTLRVMVMVDDGGWRAFSPLTSDFLITPTGHFV